MNGERESQSILQSKLKEKEGVVLQLKNEIAVYN
jgi:hypothetical protein